MLVFVGADSLETGSLEITAVRANDLVDYVCDLPDRLKEAQVVGIVNLFREGDNQSI